MNAGKMNRRLTLYTRTLTSDAAGGKTESWAVSSKVWAEQLTQTQALRFIGDADRSEDIKVFRIRYNSAITAESYRILYKSLVHDIEGVTEEGIKTALVLTCRAVKGLEL